MNFRIKCGFLPQRVLFTCIILEKKSVQKLIAYSITPSLWWHFLSSSPAPHFIIRSEPLQILKSWSFSKGYGYVFMSVVFIFTHNLHIFNEVFIKWTKLTQISETFKIQAGLLTRGLFLFFKVQTTQERIVPHRYLQQIELLARSIVSRSHEGCVICGKCCAW